MFVDASAMVAIIAGENDGNELATRLQSAGRRYTSPIAVYEATLGIARIRSGPAPAVRALIDDFIERLQIETVPITEGIGHTALDAFERFGRGRHSARLNMGDCFAYACARDLDVPLLFKGDDFSQTDIAVA
jgi:ribonuclease VapC